MIESWARDNSKYIIYIDKSKLICIAIDYGRVRVRI